MATLYLHKGQRVHNMQVKFVVYGQQTFSLTLYAEDARLKFIAWAFEKDQKVKEVKKEELVAFNSTFQKNLVKQLDGNPFFRGKEVNGADLAILSTIMGMYKPAKFLPIDKEIEDWIKRVFAASSSVEKYYTTRSRL